MTTISVLTMEQILEQILEEELSNKNDDALLVMKLIKQKSLSIDDLIRLYESAERLDTLSSLIDGMLPDILDLTPLQEFIKDIDFMMEHLFGGTGKRSAQNKGILLKSRQYLNDEIDFDVSIPAGLIKLISTVKNDDFRLRIKFLFYKIESMMIFDPDSDGNGDSGDESSEYLPAQEVKEYVPSTEIQEEEKSEKID